MESPKIIIKSKLWLYKGKGAWHFITIEKEDAAEIKMHYKWPRRGFGSIPVHVTIGETIWKTSIFPEKKGSYLLPIKKRVREKENLAIEDTIELSIVLAA